MREFSSMVVLRSTPKIMFHAMRDHLDRIAPSLSDIRSIEEIDRKSSDTGYEIVNRWYARQIVPAFLQSRLGAEEISWIDRAIWREDEMGCDWSIEPSIGQGAICCNGTTRFEPAMAGRGARALFKGSLTIAPTFVAAIMGPLQAPVTALAESIATTIIPSNFRAAAEAAAKLT